MKQGQQKNNIDHDINKINAVLDNNDILLTDISKKIYKISSKNQNQKIIMQNEFEDFKSKIDEELNNILLEFLKEDKNKKH